MTIDTNNIKFMYCTEFIIEKASKSADVLNFRHAIENKGDCMLVIDDDDIVKVHIHTNNPGFVLERAVKLGTMINIKIDNMKHQHQSLINFEEEKKFPKKETAFIGMCRRRTFGNIEKYGNRFHNRGRTNDESEYGGYFGRRKKSKCR